jgi:hypothetical protein
MQKGNLFGIKKSGEETVSLRQKGVENNNYRNQRYSAVGL